MRSVLLRVPRPLWSILEYSGYPAITIVATPLLLRALGQSSFGVWSFFIATVSLGSFLAVGTGPALIRILAVRDPAEGSAADMLLAGLWLSACSGALLAFAAAAVVWLGASTLFSEIGTREVLGLTAGATAVVAWVEQIDNVFASTLKARQNFRAAAVTELAARSAQWAGTIGGAIHGGLAGAYLAFVILALVRAGAKFMLLRADAGIVGAKFPHRAFEALFRDARWGWVQGLGGAMFNTVDRLLVGSIFGAASLAHYALASQLGQQVHALSAAAFSSTYPLISERFAQKQSGATATEFRAALLLNIGFASALAVALLAGGDWFLQLWLGVSAARYVSPLLPILTLSFWVLAINVVPHYYLMAAGRFRELAFINIIAGVISLLAMLALGSVAGLLAFASARVLYGSLVSINFLSVRKCLR